MYYCDTFGTSVLSREAVLFSEGFLYEVITLRKAHRPMISLFSLLHRSAKFGTSLAPQLVSSSFISTLLRATFVSDTSATRPRLIERELRCCPSTIYTVAQEGLAWFIFGLGLILLVVENYQAIKAVVDGGGGNSTTNATSVGVCNLFCTKDTPLNNETLGIMMEF